MAAIFGKLQKLYTEFKDSDEANPDPLLQELDSAAEQIPERAIEFQIFRFQVLSESKSRVDEAVAALNKLIESEAGEDPMFLNNLAWVLVKPDRDSKADPKLLKQALKVAKKADSLTKNENASIVDTLAKAYFDNGELEKAVTSQERVIELADGTRLAADPGLKKRLRQYKRALESAGKDKSSGDTKSSKGSN
jgi:tetratricopeptide (TPR) repeat protein